MDWLRCNFLLGYTNPRSRNGLQGLFTPHFLHGVVVLFLVLCHEHFEGTTGFLFLLVKVVDDDSDKQIERKKRPEDDEKYKVEVHVDVCLANWLLANLYINERTELSLMMYEKFEDLLEMVTAVGAYLDEVSLLSFFEK